MKRSWGLSPRQVRLLIRAGWELDAHTLTHPDLRQTARIRAFMRYVGDALAQAFEFPAPNAPLMLQPQEQRDDACHGHAYEQPQDVFLPVLREGFALLLDDSKLMLHHAPLGEIRQPAGPVHDVCTAGIAVHQCCA